MRFDVSSLFYRWTRDLHLYAGLSAGPFIILFALSAILFNHGWMPWGGVDTPATERTATFTQPPENDDSVVMGKAILRELGVGGEIGSVRRQQNPTRVTLLVQKPGIDVNISADYETGIATIREQHVGVWSGLMLLHTRPGQHLADLRGNWVYMRMWGWVADATVYLTLFLTISGLYMWFVLKAERRAGLIWLGAGILTFFALVWIVIA